MARVFIGRLSDRASERDVERFFKGYGRIKDIRLKSGYGFVEFDNERDADDAIHDLHHKELAGGRVVLEHARSGRRSPRRFDSSRRFAGNAPIRTDYRLLVENLPSRVSWQDLKDLMRKTGEVMFADAHKRRQNEGIVEFKTRADMKAALKKFDGYEISGRKLRVYEDSVRGRTKTRSRSNSSRSTSYRKGRKRSARRSSSSRRRSSRRSSSRSKSYISRPSSSRSKSPEKKVKTKSSTRSRSKSIRRSNSPMKNGNDTWGRSPSAKKSPSKEKSRSSSSIRKHSTSREKSRSKSREYSAHSNDSRRSVKKGENSENDREDSVTEDNRERSLSKDDCNFEERNRSRSRSDSENSN